MKNNFNRLKIFFVVIILLIDILFYIGISRYLSDRYSIQNTYASLIYWIIPVSLITFLLLIKFDQDVRKPQVLKKVYTSAGIFMTLYIPKLVFIVFWVLNITIRIISYAFTRLYEIISSTDLIFFDFSWLTSIGIIFSGTLFLAMIYGMVIGRFQFKVKKIQIKSHQLPESFNGIKLVHISDIHLGSWYGKEKQMLKAVNLINKLKPDMILFTGDLVNNFSEEVNGWTGILKKLDARLGKYSILGNHDYGDYWDWKDQEEKDKNMKLLIDTHHAIGFRLLLNQSETIAINGHQIGIIGVENWGKPPFMQYGDLKKATGSLQPVPFKILLSHDPTHWTAEVTGKTDIGLTLSGHTHGMQFGFKVGKLQWSPVKYLYRQWSGLYQQNGQYLYVNQGLGSLGFPGRVGIRPEITLITIYNEFKLQVTEK